MLRATSSRVTRKQYASVARIFRSITPLPVNAYPRFICKPTRPIHTLHAPPLRLFSTKGSPHHPVDQQADALIAQAMDTLMPTHVTFPHLVIADIPALRELWSFSVEKDRLCNPLARKVVFHAPFPLTTGAVLPRLEVQYVMMHEHHTHAQYNAYMASHLAHVRQHYKRACVNVLERIFDTPRTDAELALMCAHGVRVPSPQIPPPMHPEEFVQALKDAVERVATRMHDTTSATRATAVARVLTPRRAPLVLLMPSMSHSAHAALPKLAQELMPPLPQLGDSPALSLPCFSAGWWQGFVAPAHTDPHGPVAIDTTLFTLLAPAPLGGPYHTSSPRSVSSRQLAAHCMELEDASAAALGLPRPVRAALHKDHEAARAAVAAGASVLRYGGTFPLVTPLDQAMAHAWLMRHLGLVAFEQTSGVETDIPSVFVRDPAPHAIEVLADVPAFLLPSPDSPTTAFLAQGLQKVARTIANAGDALDAPPPTAQESCDDPICRPPSTIGTRKHVKRKPFVPFSPTPVEHSIPRLRVLYETDTLECSHASPVTTRSLHATVGASMGGMQVFAFASLFPGVFSRVVSMCSTAHTSPSTVALRAIQRHAVRADPRWRRGYYADNALPLDGLALARMVGTMAYRSREEFDQRFCWRPDATARFEVEGYLDHQAHAFKVRFDANCYLCLSQAMDLMDVGRVSGTYRDSVARMGGATEPDAASRRVVGAGAVEVMLLGVMQDALIPHEHMTTVAEVLGTEGVRVHHETLSSLLGHDSFLVDRHAFAPRISYFLEPSRSGVDAVRAYVRDITLY